MQAATVVINRRALRHNLQRLRELAPASKLVAVVKANAYGHGLLETARTLPDADAFGVARLEEALRLREGGITQPILLLEGFFNATDLPTIAEQHLHTAVHNIEQLEALETTAIYSVAGLVQAGTGLLQQRPFRSPHHSVSAAAIAGGGTVPRPGEVSLAHNGVLFLDELPEFSREALEVLRQPIEDGCISVSRVHGTATYPCRFMLVAAMNPCKCGYYGSGVRECSCTPSAIERYRQRISGPLLDRIDLHVEARPVEYDALAAKTGGEPSADIRTRVAAVRAMQAQRYQGLGFTCNAQLPSGMLRRYCPLAPAAEKLLRGAFERMGYSARAYDRILRVARTIADMNGVEQIGAAELMEALQYRRMDRAVGK